MGDLEQYLKNVMDDMNKTWPKYEKLKAKRSGKLLQTQPIPFFGDIRNAHVLTVGVNPSASEFGKKRNWPDEIDKMTVADLHNHLQNYFAFGQHKWFDTYEQALEPLGVSYNDGAAHLAAHLDLSPRVTASMGGANRDTFLAMMTEDARWFFRLLPECKAARLILIAGSVTGRYYMDEFVECVAYRYGYKLEEPPTPRGEGFGFNRLLGPGLDLPVFFSSISPSGGKRRVLLIQRIEEHKDRILELMNGQSVSTKTYKT